MKTLFTCIAATGFATVCSMASAQFTWWNQISPDVDGISNSSYSGSATDLSADGMTLVVGDPGIMSPGWVRIFDYSISASDWVQRGSTIIGEAPDDGSGRAVSISADGNTVAIGAPYNSGSALYAGHVRVYVWNGTAWQKRGLDIDGEAMGDLSGWSVALSDNGNVVAIGATHNDPGGDESGHTRIYAWNGTAWVQRGLDINGDTENGRLGWSVSLNGSGDVVAVGAVENGSLAQGETRIYKWNGTAWVQRGGNILGDTPYFGRFGYAVSLDVTGTVVAIGSPGDNKVADDAGKTRVFEWNGTFWQTKGSSMLGDAEGDRLGTDVALSDDGDQLIIGIPRNDDNGAESGKAKVFTWSGTAWVQKGGDLYGEAAGDEAGTAVSMSSNGTLVAVGSPNNSDNGVNAGSTRVYSWGTLWLAEPGQGDESVNGNLEGYSGTTNEELRFDSGMQQAAIFPNPTDGTVQVDLGQRYDNVQVVVTGASGTVVMTKEYTSVSAIQLDIPGKAGIYFVNLQTGTGEKTVVKVVKN